MLSAGLRSNDGQTGASKMIVECPNSVNWVSGEHWARVRRAVSPPEMLHQILADFGGFSHSRCREPAATCPAKEQSASNEPSPLSIARDQSR